MARRTDLRVAADAILGNALSSFVKRRLRIPSSGSAPGLDQIPEVLLPVLPVRAIEPVSFVLVAADVLIVLWLEPPFARLWHRWRLREHPY